MGKEKERANLRFCYKMEHTKVTLSSCREIKIKGYFFSFHFLR